VLLDALALALGAGDQLAQPVGAEALGLGVQQGDPQQPLALDPSESPSSSMNRLSGE
jgi:hypothetical protein